MKNPIPAAIVVIAMTIDLATAASNFNTVSHDGWDFKIGSPWGLDDHNHQVVSSDDGHPVRFGKFSERFEVRPGDCGINYKGTYDNCEHDKERSEMTSIDDTLHYSGDEYWYRWSLFLPKSHVNIYPAKLHVGQFYGRGCSPIFKFEEAKYGYGGTDASGELVLKFPLSHSDYPGALAGYILTTDYVGKWMDFVANIKWSHKKSGKLKIWINEELKLDYKGKTMHCHNGIYFKYGVYRAAVSRNWKYPKSGTVAYYDGIRISQTKDGMFEDLDE